MRASSGARLGAFRDQIYHFRYIPFPRLIQKAGKIIIILSTLLGYMMIKRDYVYKWLRVQCLHVCACLLSCSGMSNSWRLHGLQPARLLCSWDFPGNSAGVGCHFLLQGILLTQGLNLSLLHYGQILYHLRHQGSPCGALRNP